MSPMMSPMMRPTDLLTETLNHVIISRTFFYLQNVRKWELIFSLLRMIIAAITESWSNNSITHQFTDVTNFKYRRRDCRDFGLKWNGHILTLTQSVQTPAQSLVYFIKHLKRSRVLNLITFLLLCCKTCV